MCVCVFSTLLGRFAERVNEDGRNMAVLKLDLRVNIKVMGNVG